MLKKKKRKKAGKVRSRKKPQFPFLDISLSCELRARDLVGRLTLEEKQSQMLYDSRAIPRLGIPEYNWWSEACHGVAGAGEATVFPQNIGLGASFDRKLLGRIGTAISDEARAKYEAASARGNRGMFQGLTFWAPNINIFRDPRWGRGQETCGEDPYLTGELGVSFVRGMQGRDKRYLKTAACAKHFAVHSGPEAKRHSFDALPSRRDLAETYLPAFKKLVQAGVEAVMGAYSRLYGEPCCGSRSLLTDLLRGEWGFRGHVVSDCWAVQDFHQNHKVTQSPEESAALAVKSGCDLNCGCTYAYLTSAVAQGLLTEKEMDESLVRLFVTRMKLGMFDPPDRVPWTKIRKDVIASPAHRKLAYEAAVKSFVLLKNKDGVLPLQNPRNILLTGPNFDSNEVLYGNYNGFSSRMTTFLQGFVETMPEGTGFSTHLMPDHHLRTFSIHDWFKGWVKKADVLVAFMGVTPAFEGEEGSARYSDMNGDRASVALPAHQTAYVMELAKLGKPLIVVITSGSAVAAPEVHAAADAVIYSWYPGEEGGRALARMLAGIDSPSGRLPLTVPVADSQLPDFEDYSMKGRTYRYMTEEPLYPFGFGLTYGKAEYLSLVLSSARIRAGEGVDLSVKVKNVSGRSMEEVVQIYLSFPDWPDAAFFTLAEFGRIRLAPGKTGVVSFRLDSESFSRADEKGVFAVRPGRVIITASGAAPLARSLELGASRPVSCELVVTA